LSPLPQQPCRNLLVVLFVLKELDGCASGFGFPKPRTLGEQLVWHRRALGLSQRRFVMRLEIDQGTLGRWERDERTPSERLLILVQFLLGVDECRAD
jgi:hypothetical protein